MTAIPHKDKAVSVEGLRAVYDQLGNMINSSSSTGHQYKQITKLNITAAPVITNIRINKTTTFNRPPVEVLKFVEGEENQTVNLITFDSGDGSRFNHEEDMITFDGKANFNYTHQISMSKPSMITDGTVTGYISESAEIDLSKYKSVDSVSVV